MSTVWIDVDNPPQAQYLSPVVTKLRHRDHRVFLTSRDHPQTLAVLANRGEESFPIGGSFGKAKFGKTFGTVLRAARLAPLVARHIGRPDAVVSTSRSGVLAAWLMKSTSFSILDYEGVDTSVYRLCGSHILYPEAIPSSEFVKQGISEANLIPFPGLKEDITFSDLDHFDEGSTCLPKPRDARLPAVLVRPPSESSHYRVEASMQSLERVMDYLAKRPDVQVVFSPREAQQIEMVNIRKWNVSPVVLERTVSVTDLLRAVDRVVSGGGTMLREAAWAGVPAVSLFQGQIPAVDRWLESKGAVTSIGPNDDLDEVPWDSRMEATAFGGANPAAIDTVIASIESVQTPGAVTRS